MMFQIEIPGYTLKTIEAGSYQEAIEDFEAALWQHGLLDEDENLSATDLGHAGGRTLEDVLMRQGFLNFTCGEGEDAPCISEVAEEDASVCGYCDTLVTEGEIPDEGDDEAWQWLALDHRQGCKWIETRAFSRFQEGR